MGDLLINIDSNMTNLFFKPIRVLTATNSIGLRLSNTATIDQVGQQILTLNI